MISNEGRDNSELTGPPAKSLEETEASNAHEPIASDQPSVSEQTLVERIDKSDRWMIVLTAAIAFSAIVSALISGGQLWALQGQLEEAKQTRTGGDKSTADQLAVMRTQATAMQAQAEASKIAAETSKLGFTAAQRAWLGPTDASLDKLPVVGGNITMTANYANTGREPAINVFRELRPFKVKADFSNGSNGAGSEFLKATIP